MLYGLKNPSYSVRLGDDIRIYKFRHRDNQKGHAGPAIKYAGPNEFLFGPKTYKYKKLYLKSENLCRSFRKCAGPKQKILRSGPKDRHYRDV